MGRSRRSSPRRRAPAPAKRTPAAAPAQRSSSSGGGMLSGIGSTIAQGMAFGTGSAIAHRAVGAVAGGLSGGSEEASEPVQAAQPVQAQNNCMKDEQSFMQCLNTSGNDIASCQFYFDALNDCKRGNTYY